MKLLIMIVQAYDADRLLRSVTSEGLGATKINSVGGFLRMANATVMMALEKERVPRAIELIRETSQRRVEVHMDPTQAEYSDWYTAGLHEVPIGGAVVFVMPLDAMYQINEDSIDLIEKSPSRE